ncbi:MAG: gfo/Idh/MocA family oxidoreductase, partial [Rubripirellula sp.]
MSEFNHLQSESPASSLSSQASRRQFIKSSATTVGAVAAVTVADTQDAAAVAPIDKIRIGFIGPGGRGFGAHVKRLTKLQLEGEPIELVAVCDVYNEHRDRAASYIEKQTGKAPSKHEDYLEMFAKANLDAVVI